MWSVFVWSRSALNSSSILSRAARIIDARQRATASSRTFDGRHRDDTVDSVRGELHLVSLLQALEQLQVGHAEDHGHAWHVEVGNWAVLQGELALFFVHLANFAVHHRRGRCRLWVMTSVPRIGLLRVRADREGKRRNGNVV